MTELATLTRAEEDYLVQCEETISYGLQTFIEVGTALAMIRDNRLYRAEHATFETYCGERWGFTDRRARQLIDAAAIGRILPVANAGQAAELARVPEPERADVWRETVERTEGKPTAAAIRETYERTQTPATSPEPEPDGADVAAGSGHDHPEPSPDDDLTAGRTQRFDSVEEMDVALNAAADSPTGPASAPSAEHPRTPDRSGPTDPVDDPEHIERQRREGSSDAVAEALVAVKMRLEPDPVRWFTETWLPGRYRFRDMPRVRDCFTPDGLRASAKHLELLADHLERTGGSL